MLSYQPSKEVLSNYEPDNAEHGSCLKQVDVWSVVTTSPQVVSQFYNWCLAISLKFAFLHWKFEEVEVYGTVLIGLSLAYRSSIDVFDDVVVNTVALKAIEDIWKDG